MKPVRRILVAVKDTEIRSQPSAEKACLLARRFGASLELFHAIAEPVYFDSPDAAAKFLEVRERRREWHLGHLQRTAARMCEAGVEASVYADWDFPAYEAIIRRALAIKADLIVADSYARSRLARWFLHLTDWELLRLSPVPVLLVKTRELYDRPIMLAAVDPMHAHAKPAKLDKAILDYGTGFARTLSGSLHALHVHFTPLGDSPGQIVSDPRTGIVQTRLEQKARASFSQCANAAGVPHARQHFVNGIPSVVLPQEARRLGADLVVMGAISRSGLRRILIGNTAERILGALQSDVLVIKPESFGRRIARMPRGARVVSTQGHQKYDQV
jgi:universal stress protein E